MLKGISSLGDEEFSFWKKLVLFVIFFTITPITLGTSLFSLFSLSKNSALHSLELPKSGAKIYASLPSLATSVSGYAEGTDARSQIISQYLARYNSPLTPYADLIVETADRYGLDYRLITAIAQQESNLCKVIPLGSHNCWGWGIHSQGTLGFSSFPQGIEEVSKGIKEEYIDKGFVTIEDIMKKYTPLSNGSWALAVGQFMAEME